MDLALSQGTSLLQLHDPTSASATQLRVSLVVAADQPAPWVDALTRFTWNESATLQAIDGIRLVK